MTDAKAPIGDLIDSLGVVADPFPEGSLVSDVVVLLKVIDAHGQVGLHIADVPHASWLEHVGMYEAARHLECAATYEDDED